MNRPLPPRFIISPAAIRTSFWTPRIFQIVCCHENPSYLNSFWLGTVWNVATLPFRAVTEVVWPLFNFRLFPALVSALLLPVTFILMFFYGITGRVASLSVTLEQRMSSLILTPEKSQQLVDGGNQSALISMAELPTNSAFGCVA